MFAANGAAIASACDEQRRRAEIGIQKATVSKTIRPQAVQRRGKPTCATKKPSP